MKKTRIFALLFIIMILLSGCTKNTENVKIDLGESEIYSQKDLNSTAEMILSEIGSWNSVKRVYTISYCGDDYSVNQLDYCNSLSDKNFTHCVVFESSFRTSSSSGSGGFNPNSCYEWEWWLAKTDDGEWELLTWGYP